jgi:hypothetical protein
MGKEKTGKIIEYPGSKKPEEKTIRITCEGAGLIDWHIIKPLQGNFKKRTEEDIEKIIRSILKYGFAFPAQVSKIGNDIWCLDAHGRLLAFAELERRGYSVPPIPVDYVHAKDKKEAKQLLLRCDSRYGTITQEGYVEFTEDIIVEVEDLSLDIEIVSENDGDSEPKKVNLEPYNKIHVLLSFEPAKFADIQEQLEIIKNTEGIEYGQSAN